jgi:transcriptional antiterminator RfaH
MENKKAELAWYVVYTNPREEGRAGGNLSAWSLEIFSPRIKERRSHPFTGEPIYAIKPLFPRYIFARFDLEKLFHKIRFTRGVHSLVSFGNRPVAVDKEVIELIHSRVGKDGVIDMWDDLQPGDHVTVNDGPLKGLNGIFERPTKDSERVMILLDTVNYQARLQVERQGLRKITP